MIQEFKTTLERRDITIWGNPFKYNVALNCDDPQCDKIELKWSLSYTFKEWGVKDIEIHVNSFEFDVYTDDDFSDGDHLNYLSGQSMYFNSKCDDFEIEFEDAEETISNGYIGAVDIDFDNKKIQIS